MHLIPIADARIVSPLLYRVDWFWWLHFQHFKFQSTRFHDILLHQWPYGMMDQCRGCHPPTVAYHLDSYDRMPSGSMELLTALPTRGWHLRIRPRTSWFKLIPTIFILAYETYVMWEFQASMSAAKVTRHQYHRRPSLETQVVLPVSQALTSLS